MFFQRNNFTVDEHTAVSVNGDHGSSNNDLDKTERRCFPWQEIAETILITAHQQPRKISRVDEQTSSTRRHLERAPGTPLHAEHQMLLKEVKPERYNDSHNLR